jgi:nitroreductase
MDGDTRMSRASFFRLLGRLLPCRHLPPFSSFPWRPQIHLVLFIHRVEGLEPGLYFLARGADAAGRFQRYARRDFAWTRPEGCLEGLGLSLLLSGDAREVARSISCHQEIASDGVFAVAMLAEYEGALKEHGPSFYRRLHWEAGAVGQMLYLEAEAEGLRGTGIGCFFDDGMHDLLGITDTRYQTLYHFTLGKAMEDKRLKTLPAYWHREEAAAEALKREKEGGTRT